MGKSPLHRYAAGRDPTGEGRRSAAPYRSAYRLLAEHSRDAISLHHPDGRFIYANPHYAALFGYSQEELHALSAEELSLLVHPDDLPRSHDEAHQQVLRGETVTRLEFRFRRKDGEYTWVENVSVPILDDDGQVAQILATTRDISERKRIEEQIELQFTALEATANAIVITDRTARIQWVNPAFSRLTGYTIEEARGSNPNMLVKSGLHDEGFYREMWDTILSGNVWFGKLINRRKDGSLYTEEQTITPVYDNDGKISHFIAIKQDITERERSQQVLLDYEGLKARFQMEQEQNALIQQTIAALSHDIRTPLSVIATTKRPAQPLF
ncbi:PAS domain S-box protein [bacterium]|nr:PAS domain S-box protein [bacterium]